MDKQAQEIISDISLNDKKYSKSAEIYFNNLKPGSETKISFPEGDADNGIYPDNYTISKIDKDKNFVINNISLEVKKDDIIIENYLANGYGMSSYKPDYVDILTKTGDAYSHSSRIESYDRNIDLPDSEIKYKQIIPHHNKKELIDFGVLLEDIDNAKELTKENPFDKKATEFFDKIPKGDSQELKTEQGFNIEAHKMKNEKILVEVLNDRGQLMDGYGIKKSDKGYMIESAFNNVKTYDAKNNNLYLKELNQDLNMALDQQKKRIKKEVKSKGISI